MPAIKVRRTLMHPNIIPPVTGRVETPAIPAKDLIIKLMGMFKRMVIIIPSIPETKKLTNR